MTHDFRQSAPLNLLYRDPWLAAVDKPSGMLVHRSAIDRHETIFAMQTLRDMLGQRVYPLHRLDKPTSGVLLFALDRETARTMGERFGQRQVAKRYLGLVRGWPGDSPDQQGWQRIDHPLKEELDAYTDELADPDKPAQTAITRYRVRARCELPIANGRHPSSRYALVEAWPETGRKHQIRRHMKHIFHPLVGDTTYGDGRHNRIFRDHFDNRRLLLAATRLQFNHPHTNESVRIDCAPSEAMARVIREVFPAFDGS
jgi:tRNA pseudouridine65 synthase